MRSLLILALALSATPVDESFTTQSAGYARVLDDGTHPIELTIGESATSNVTLRLTDQEARDIGKALTVAGTP